MIAVVCCMIEGAALDGFAQCRLANARDVTVQWAGIGADWTYYRSSKIHVLPRATATVAVALRSATATCRSSATPA